MGDASTVRDALVDADRAIDLALSHAASEEFAMLVAKAGIDVGESLKDLRKVRVVILGAAAAAAEAACGERGYGRGA